MGFSRNGKMITTFYLNVNYGKGLIRLTGPLIFWNCPRLQDALYL